MTRDLVFVSYSHLDTTWREQLHVMLKPWIYDGLQYWADDYIRVGDEWERKIDGAIERAQVAVLLLSQAFFGSRFIRERELPPLLAAASHGALRVFCLPVEPCTYVMAELEHFQFPWRTPLRSQTKRQRLEALASVAKRIADGFDLRGTIVTTAADTRVLAPVTGGETVGELFGAPDLPTHYHARTVELARLKAALLGNERGTVGIAAAVRHGVHGIGGVGKTVLARALAGEADTRAAFPDGVFWLSLGQTPEVLQLQLQLARWLGDRPAFTNVMDAREHLRGLLVDKRCLLVLDDVWHHEHGTAFEVLGPRGRLLVTTRDKQILNALGAHTTSLDVLDVASSLALLAEGAAVARDALPPEATEVANECGHLPLALTLAAAQVCDGISWCHVLGALRAGDLAFLDHPHGSVFKTVDASVRALSQDEAERYRELSFVPEDVRVPEAVIARYWQYTAGLSSHTSAKLVRRFAAKGLLSLHEGPASEISFHDLQLDYLRLVAAQDRLAHQRALLDCFANDLPSTRAGCPRWAALAPEHVYLWRKLSHHALEAQRAEELKAAICDVRWLKGKLKIQGLASLLVELAQTVPQLLHADCDHVERALRVDGGTLYLEPSALDGLLYTRLRCEGWDAERIERTIADLAPALRLRHPVYLGSRSERRRFEGHTKWVNACAYSPDGKRVLSASADGTLREWDAESGKETQRFEGHSRWVGACAYRPDGKRVLSALADGTLREWDVASGEERQRFEGHAKWVNSCVYSADGQRVLSAAADGTLREWDTGSGKERRRFAGHRDSVRACAYSPDGKRVIADRSNGALQEWDAESGVTIRYFERHGDTVRACTYSPDGKRLLSASDDRTLREWDVERGQERRRFEGHTATVRACAYSPDGTRVLSASDDRTLREWDVETGKERQRFEGHSAAVRACAYSPDGRRVLSASDDRTLREWDAEGSDDAQQLERRSRWIRACAFSPDRQRVLSGSADGTLRELDVKSGKETRRFKGHAMWVNTCAYSPDGERVLSGSADGTLRAWDARSGNAIHRFVGHAGAVRACAYSPDGRRMLSASDDGTLRAWDTASGREQQRFEGHRDGVRACAYSPDGKRVLSAADDGTLREWDAESGRETKRLEGHSRWVRACAYSSDGARMLSAFDDGTVREWDVESGRETRRFDGHSRWVRACAYSLHGEYVVSASEDRTVRVFRRATGVCVAASYGVRAFTSVAATDTQVAAGDEAGNVWLFDLLLSRAEDG